VGSWRGLLNLGHVNAERIGENRTYSGVRVGCGEPEEWHKASHQ